MLPQAVSDHYRAQQRLIVAALGLTRREWETMGGDWDASWAKIAPRVNLLTASAQLGAASSGAAYVADTLAEYGDDIASLADVNPRAFAGVASDGRPLGSLLDGALFQAKSANSLEAGGKWLDMVVHTQIADAGRGAASVAIAARPGVGWVRMVNPPCCGPCAVLSGREYRYSHGFQRHPRCDCVHVPTTLANPGSHFGVDPTLDQITDLTAGERKALLEGGDLSRVINARRGGGVGKMHTTALAKRGKARLTPDGIFATAKDRDEALRLLKDHGYVTPTARRVSAGATKKASVQTAAPKPKFDPKWREGRDVRVVKSNTVDAEAKAARWRREVDQREGEIARLERLIAERKAELRDVYGVPARSVSKTIKQEGPYQNWTRELEIWRERLPAYRQGLDDALRELDRLRSAETALPDFDPNNPLKFYGDRYTFHDESDKSIRFASDWETFDEDLHVLMRNHFAEVDDGGVYVGGARDLTDVDDLSYLKGQQARGHNGRTFDDVGGLYDPSRRVCGCSHKSWHSDVHSTALHEGGHVIDDALGQASTSAEWKAAHEAVPMKDWLNPYYSASGNSTGYLSESFAEALGSYQRGKNLGLDGDDLAEFVGRAMGVNPSNTISGENAATLTGRPLVDAIRVLIRRVGR